MITRFIRFTHKQSSILAISFDISCWHSFHGSNSPHTECNFNCNYLVFTLFTNPSLYSGRFKVFWHFWDKVNEISSLRKRYTFLIGRALSIILANIFIFAFFIMSRVGFVDYVTILTLVTIQEANFFFLGCRY